MVAGGSAGPVTGSVEPRWADALAICGRLRADGWRSADPLGGPDAPDAPDVTVGGAVGIQLCRVTRTLPSAARGRPPALEVFLQHRGGHAANITAGFWQAADRAATLAAAADLTTRLARDLGITLPPELTAAVLTADTYDDTHAGVSLRVTTSTREEEVRVQHDLKPESVPLLSVEISFTPPE
jgi:hypothetical protein